MLIASDRVVAYLRTVGFERGDLWGGIGFVLGLLLIAYGMLELKPPPALEITATPWIGYGSCCRTWDSWALRCCSHFTC